MAENIQDILAVAYGEAKPSTASTAGLVLCWSLKNPEWPERTYRTRSPVTSLDFSKSNPNLLACGFADGRICIYDVRRKGEKAVLDNSDSTGKHRDPVWELKWVERERVVGDEQSRNETLVSVSTDGRVVQWMVRKGLEYADLMTLKRVTKSDNTPQTKPSKPTSTSTNTAFIARQAGGLSFDFNPRDTNTYLVATDTGPLHRCSCSYNEQYLATYCGHTGPVHRVRWSPFLSGVWLSCGSDWSVRLWRVGEGGGAGAGAGSGGGGGGEKGGQGGQGAGEKGGEGESEGEECIFKFLSGKDTISDIAWSPTISTMFGCVSTDGRMEIWDLSFSVLDPVILHSVLDRQLTTIIFASQTPCILTGDDNGAVNVYKLRMPVKETLHREGGEDGEGEEGDESGRSAKERWREEQGRVLEEVIRAKNQNMGGEGGGGGGGGGGANAGSG
ncbi:WD repeat-containing protein 78 [Rhizophlyctis rosea]|nr:WD repeat-containing protein 78 [Rhizophlyctis rosea]